MAGPTVRRDGDVWHIAWTEHGVAMGIDRLKETSDGLKAEVTIESGIGGRVVGPVTLNLLNTRSQAELANRCFKRVNNLKQETWDGLMVYACAIVAKQYRSPTPTIDLSQLEDAGPVDYLIPGLVPRAETTVVYGDGESTKSLLCLLVSLCVSMGRELPWGARPQAGNVLYLDWETNARTVASRLRRLALGELCAVPTVHYRQCFRSLTDELPNIREQISKMDISLVVVDSIGFAASGALVEDETARSAMNALRQMTPATRLVVAHVSKSASESPGPVKPFGSAFFWNGMRSGIEVRRSEDQASDNLIDIGLYHRKANDGRHERPIGMSVMFDGADGGILFSPSDLGDVPDLAARTPLSSRIRNMLRNGAQTTRKVADELDVKENVVRVTLGRMEGVTRLESGGGRGKESTWGLSQ
jgi:AAA domain